MRANVARIVRYPAKGAPGEVIAEAALLAGIGMDGDRHQGGERQISLLLAQARAWMAEQPEPGLCFGRFRENLLIEGLPTGALAVGGLLSVGCARLRISAQSKHCFPECALNQGGAPCLLPACAAFAVVERGGAVRAGDPVSVQP